MISPLTHRPVGARLALADRPAVLRGGAAPVVLSALLAVVAAAASTLSLFVPSLVLGPDVTRGNLRGTALVVLVVGLPLLVVGVVRARAHSARGAVLWLGGLAYLTYQAVLFCFGTPMNRLFLLYVAWLGLAVFSLAATVNGLDTAGFGARIDRRVPARAVASVLATIGVGNGVAWLARTVPAALSGDPGAPIAGSGMTTNPVFVQDLAFWIPVAVASAVLLWRRDSRGVLVGGGVLAFYVVESLSVATDQWWGARADPTHPDLASTAVVAPAAVLAVLVLVPLVALLRNVDRAAP